MERGTNAHVNIRKYIFIHTLYMYVCECMPNMWVKDGLFQ